MPAMKTAELIKRLRAQVPAETPISVARLMDDAADALEAHATRIASLEARVAELEIALGPFAGAYDARRRSDINGSVLFTQPYLRAARLALKGADHDRD